MPPTKLKQVKSEVCNGAKCEPGGILESAAQALAVANLYDEPQNPFLYPMALSEFITEELPTRPTTRQLRSNSFSVTKVAKTAK